MEIAKILVPLDGSALAEAALDRAIALADRDRTKVILLRAAESTTFPGADPVEGQVAVVREAEEYLERVAGRLRQAGLRQVETSVWYGPPAAAIIEAAEFQKPDLIVMNSHGRSGIGRLILGSVAESVLRGTATPILLLRAAGAPVDARRGQARPVKESPHA